MINNSPLDPVRAEIDEVDFKLLKLLKQRSDLVKQVTAIKKEHGLTAHQPERFENMMKELHLQAEALQVNSKLVDAIWNAIHHSSQNQQNKTLL